MSSKKSSTTLSDQLNNKPVHDLSKEVEAAGRDLSECLFSQYSLTFAGISTSTAYAVYKKPPNGLAIMMGAGVAGTLADLGYGWTTACKSQVSQWTSLREQLKQQKETQQ